MQTVRSHHITVPRTLALLLIAAVLAVSILLSLARTAPGLAPATIRAAELPVNVCTAATATGGSNDPSPLFGPQP